MQLLVYIWKNSTDLDGKMTAEHSYYERQYGELFSAFIRRISFNNQSRKAKGCVCQLSGNFTYL